MIRKVFEKISEKIKAIKEHGNTPFSLGDEVDNYNSAKKFASFALIIDGEAINSTFHNDKLKDIFLGLIPQFR